MNDWIDFNALGKIILIGVIAGAGLPALFAVGLKALTAGESSSGSGSSTAVVSRNPALVAVAVICFAVVVAAIAWGIYLIVNK